MTLASLVWTIHWSLLSALACVPQPSSGVDTQRRELSSYEWQEGSGVSLNDQMRFEGSRQRVMLVGLHVSDTGRMAAAVVTTESTTTSPVGEGATEESDIAHIA